MQTIANRHIKKHVENNNHVDIFLINGIKLSGIIKEYDDECIILNTDQLIMRSAIMTIQVSR